MNLKVLDLLYPGAELRAAGINPDAAKLLGGLIGEKNLYLGSIFDYPTASKVDLSLIKSGRIQVEGLK